MAAAAKCLAQEAVHISACLCCSRRSRGGKPSSRMVHHNAQAYLHKGQCHHLQASLMGLLGHLSQSDQAVPPPRTVQVTFAAPKLNFTSQDRSLAPYDDDVLKHRCTANHAASIHLPPHAVPATSNSGPPDELNHKQQVTGRAATHQCTAIAIAMAAALSRRAPKLNSCRTSEM